VALDAAVSDPTLGASVAHNLAYNCLAASEYDDAVTYAEEALRRLDPVTDAAWGAQFLVTAAFAYLCRDRFDDATMAIDAAEPRAAGTDREKYVHYVRGEIARRRGDREEAARHFKKLEVFYPGIPTLTEMLLSMNIAPFLLPE
jgi:tetratricopeptide (TPR) repeat protein